MNACFVLSLACFLWLASAGDDVILMEPFDPLKVTSLCTKFTQMRKHPDFSDLEPFVRRISYLLYILKVRFLLSRVAREKSSHVFRLAFFNFYFSRRSLAIH